MPKALLMAASHTHTALTSTDVRASSIAVRALPQIHTDPFDRLLVAQAVCERATIVSADTVFDEYPVTRMW